MAKFNKYKILLFLTALSELVSPYISNFSGGGNFQQLLITPAGYTFAIWGAITIFSFIFATYHLFFDKKTFSNKFYLYLYLVYILFTVWLLVAERSWLGLTVLVFIPMYYSLLKAWEEVIYHHKLQNFWDKAFLQGGLGMYVGWTTIAIVLNIGVWLFSFGVDNYSEIGLLLQTLLIVGATSNAIFVLRKYKYNIVLFGTFWWAFVGLLVGLLGRAGTGNLIVVTLVAVAFLNYVYFRNRKNS